MAMPAGNSEGPSPRVGSAFAQQYYKVLNQSPEHVHKFYHDESILGRPGSDGFMTYVTTSHAINEEFISSDLRCCLIELQDVDTQPSYEGGMLTLVTGYIITPDTVKHRFTQSFFLAPQENGGYFVLNDMLRYKLEKPSAEATESLANNDTEITHIASFPADPESIKESATSELPSAQNNLVHNEVINPHTEITQGNVLAIAPPADNIYMNENVTSPSAENISVEMKDISPSAENISVKRDVRNPSANENSHTNDAVKKCVEEVTAVADPIPEAAPATSASAQKDVSKKSYASIVKDMKDSTLPPPIVNPKSKPKPPVKRAENVEPSASVTVKLTQAAETSPPNDKNVSNEQGYSVFVKNLPFNATVEMVESEFKKFGVIKPGGIQVRNRQPDQFCFGFVEFESQQSMRAAIEASPIRFGSKQSYVEEKRTTKRVVNGVVIDGHDNANIRGSRIQPGRGGYHGQGSGFMNNSNYRDCDNFRNNSYRDDDNFRGQGTVFRNNNSYRDGDNFSGQRVGFRGNNYRDGDNFRGRGAGFVSNGNYRDNANMRNEFRNQGGYSGRGQGPQGNGYHRNGNGYPQNRNGYHQNMNGYHESRPFHTENVNGRATRTNGPKQTPVAA